MTQPSRQTAAPPVRHRPSAPVRSGSRPPAASYHQAFVLDQKNMRLLWLEEKVARRELTQAQADAMFGNQATTIKNWVGPVKDGLGSGKLFIKMARGFASWKGAQVVFTKSRAGHDLVIFKGWPRGRKIISGTRYRLDHPKIVEMQIGKPGLRAAAKESARFGIYLVVAVDIADYVMRDNATLGQLLGALTVDVPSVLLASAIGAAAGTAVSGTALGSALVIGSFAAGPLLVAFAVGVIVGYALYRLDEHFHLGERLGRAFDQGLDRLAELWDELGDEAEERYNQLVNSRMVNDLRQESQRLADRIARQADRIRGDLVRLW